jgi:sporulation killing factor
MSNTEKQKETTWESLENSSLSKPAGVSLVKSVGCAACWAAKSISLTRACLPPTPVNLAI